VTPGPLRVLVVEDDLVDQLAIRRLVREGALPYDVTMASSVAEASEALESSTFDAVVTDFGLGDGSALDVLAAAGDLPSVIVTGAGDQEKATSGMKAGAADYLVKEVDHRHLAILGPAIERAVHVKAQDRRMKMLVHALEHIGEAVCLSAPSGKMVFVNRAFCELYGFPEEEAIGRGRSLWPGAGPPESDASGEGSGDVTLATKGGRELTVSLTCSAVHDDAGRVIGTVRIMRDVTERERIARELRHANAALEHSRAAFEELATRDALTGLFNRRELDRRMAIEASRASRTETQFSFVLLDVDHFKSINDRFGHPAGDEVLRRLSRLVQREVRATDTAARYGGEEIALILPDTSAEEAVRVAERLRKCLEAEVFAIGEGPPVTVTASFGVATVEAHAVSPEAVFAAADEALYEAKVTGRNRVVARSSERRSSSIAA
jgi:diguanylate cyclase (GGDEF)-like protein/PAS domain S-box-containing protein